MVWYSMPAIRITMFLIGFSCMAGCMDSDVPQISSPLKDQTATLGATISFKAEAHSSQGLSYYWRKSGVNKNLSTNATLTLVNVQYSDSGIYSCEICTSVDCSSVSAKLFVVAP